MDLKGNRIYIGAKKCLEEGVGNAAFLRTLIDKIPNYFQPGEVEEIWLTFPDPQLRTSRAKKRLTHPRFLRLYKQFLKAGGNIHLKTDSPQLYRFTKMVIEMYGLNLIEDIPDISRAPQNRSELFIQTYYESLDIAGSSQVHYLCFSLPDHPLPDLDLQLHQRLKENEKTID